MNHTGGARTPRPEYPRPQFVRAEWMSLNGSWEFDTGMATGVPSTWTLERSILVPFAPESDLSGIGETGFMPSVRYRCTVAVPPAWVGRRLLLHFGAVDHDATVWVNDRIVGRHRGGFTPFTVDITDAVDADSFVLGVAADDDPSAVQARGKQSRRLENYEAFYTRTTGIWQSVWLEPVQATHLGRPTIVPDLAGGSFRIRCDLSGPRGGATVSAYLFDGEEELAAAAVRADASIDPEVTLVVPEGRIRPWHPEDPHLYRVRFEVRIGDELVDELESYAGLRSVAIDGRRVLINGEPLFQRLVLDQGYWPDSLMTAPSDAALVDDIELGLAAGFNGARLHQKVFEERYLYHADRLGYLVWGEFADWGANLDPARGDQRPTASFVAEWLEAVARDLSHPSIVGWCPLNETYEPIGQRPSVLDDVTRALYLATKAADPTRPVIDASGYSHRVAETDIYDAHLYEQNVATFAEQMAGLADGSPYVNRAPDGTEWSVPYAGQPYFCSEFGGIWWSETDAHGDTSWGYGIAPRSKEEWLARFRGLVDVLLDDPDMFGYCYTQLTDVFQERNGIADFARKPKFDLSALHAIQSRPAAIELSRVRLPAPAAGSSTDPATTHPLAVARGDV